MERVGTLSYSRFLEGMLSVVHLVGASLGISFIAMTMLENTPSIPRFFIMKDI